MAQQLSFNYNFEQNGYIEYSFTDEEKSLVRVKDGVNKLNLNKYDKFNYETSSELILVPDGDQSDGEFYVEVVLDDGNISFDDYETFEFAVEFTKKKIRLMNATFGGIELDVDGRTYASGNHEKQRGSLVIKRDNKSKFNRRRDNKVELTFQNFEVRNQNEDFGLDSEESLDIVIKNVKLDGEDSVGDQSQFLLEVNLEEYRNLFDANRASKLQDKDTAIYDHYVPVFYSNKVSESLTFEEAVRIQTRHKNYFYTPEPTPEQYKRILRTIRFGSYDHDGLFNRDEDAPSAPFNPASKATTTWGQIKTRQ